MEQTLYQLNHAVNLIIPEVILISTVCLMLFAAPFLTDERGTASPGLRHRWGWLSLIALAFAGYMAFNSPATHVPTATFSSAAAVPASGTSIEATGPFRHDQLAVFVRAVAILAGVVLVLINWNQANDGRAAEGQASLLAIIAGMSLVGNANDIVALFLALELISLPTYLFLLMPLRDAQAQEATIKYFLLSVFSSAILLFGLSYLYGVTGSTNLHSIYAAISSSPERPILLGIAVIMILVGLAFRVTAVPFHFYAPDVFQGGPLSAAAMLSFVPKVAGLIALTRLLSPAVVEGQGATLLVMAKPMIWWLAVLTMFAGNMLALLQTDLRRILAYSSVAHAGYMLIGLYVGRGVDAQTDGIEAMLIYLAIYGVMTLGAFATLACLGADQRRVETLNDLRGLGRSRPLFALMMAIFLFSLTGLPPTAGFLGKFFLFLAAWNEGSDGATWLAIWLAVNAAIGAGYYLRMLSTMYLYEPGTDRSTAAEPPALAAMWLCSAATIGLFLVPNVLVLAVNSL